VGFTTKKYLKVTWYYPRFLGNNKLLLWYSLKLSELSIPYLVPCYLLYILSVTITVPWHLGGIVARMVSSHLIIGHLSPGTRESLVVTLADVHTFLVIMISNDIY